MNFILVPSVPVLFGNFDWGRAPFKHSECRQTHRTVSVVRAGMWPTPGRVPAAVVGGFARFVGCPHGHVGGPCGRTKLTG